MQNLGKMLVTATLVLFATTAHANPSETNLKIIKSWRKKINRCARDKSIDLTNPKALLDLFLMNALRFQAAFLAARDGTIDAAASLLGPEGREEAELVSITSAFYSVFFELDQKPILLSSNFFSTKYGLIYTKAYKEVKERAYSAAFARARSVWDQGADTRQIGGAAFEAAEDSVFVWLEEKACSLEENADQIPVELLEKGIFQSENAWRQFHSSLLMKIREDDKLYLLWLDSFEFICESTF